MTDNIQLSLPHEVANIISNSREELNNKLIELLILELYHERKISSGKAAEILNISKASFINFSSARGIPHIDLSQDEIVQDYRNLKEAIDESNLP